MFSDEELNNFMGVQKFGSEYIEIYCGCTVNRLGDSGGILRVYVDGNINIDCHCHDKCPKGNIFFLVICNNI